MDIIMIPLVALRGFVLGLVRPCTFFIIPQNFCYFFITFFLIMYQLMSRRSSCAHLLTAAAS